MLKSSCNSRIEGQIYNNFIEMRDLGTGKLIDELPCNVKSIDVSSSKTQLLEYSQAIMIGRVLLVLIGLNAHIYLCGMLIMMVKRVMTIFHLLEDGLILI